MAKETENRYRVIPLPNVQKWGKRELSSEQRWAGIHHVRLLRYYPFIPDLSIEPCGDGMELRIEHPSIGRQGWLRAIFWIHEKTKTIYIVDVFWKKENQISRADILRANHRIKRLRSGLLQGQKPWS